MMKSMLCFCHSQTHGLMRVRATGVVPTVTAVVSNLCSGLIVTHGVTPAVPLEVQTKAPPIIWHLLGGWQVTETCLDYEN